jgi:hypothetical protein
LGYAELQGADLREAQLQATSLCLAQLQGADLRAAQVGSADFTKADLTLSDLQGLSWWRLDETAYKKLEGRLMATIRDEQLRTTILERIKTTIGRDLQLNVAAADQVLCDDANLFSSCLTREEIAEYADTLAAFLGTLGCDNGAIARGLLTQFWSSDRRPPSPMTPVSPMQIVFAKHATARLEKDCPGWAALPADWKNYLRKLAVEETSTR